MTNTKKIILNLLLLAGISTSFNALALVKLSSGGICHDTSSSFYNRTKNYTAFDNLQDCVKSGGRKAYSKSNKSSSSTIHDRVKQETSSYSKKKYNRKLFSHWIDEDKDCMNTRHEILQKTSTGQVTLGPNKCFVVHGRWNDPYTGIIFSEARALDIDHIVPLKWAWDHGADNWSKAKRREFANADVNLLAVKASVNRQKSAKGPLRWLPPAKNFQCQYILRFTRIAKMYELTLSPSETSRMRALKQKLCN